MTDKQKQIKEISELISNYYHNGSFVRKGSLSEMIYDKLFPKDCVVLSREEWKQIKNSLYYSKEALEKKLEKSSRRTAEKILIKGKQLVEKWLSRDDEKVGFIFDFEEFIKQQFRVEIEESH